MQVGFNLPFRQLKGVLVQLLQYVPGLYAADFSLLWRRIRAIGFHIKQIDAFYPQSEDEDEDEGVITAIDATGMKVTNKGEWMREKWKKKRGWIKVHIIVDVNVW